MFAPGEARQLVDKTGFDDPERLAACVLECGFDPAAYVEEHPDLRRAGLNPEAGLVHYLLYGVDEERAVPGGVLFDGLAPLASLLLSDRDYLNRLGRSLYWGQLRHPETARRLWEGVGPERVQVIRHLRGLPYIVIGDSHAGHYVRPVRWGARWLAGLPLTCTGSTATSLADIGGTSGAGRRILDWARVTGGSSGLPIFLKFGGLDAEYFWVWRRLRDGVIEFSIPQFTEFVADAIARYGEFLDALCLVMPRAAPRICSVFPAVLPDLGWTAYFAELYRHPLGAEPALKERLARIEVPCLRMRTRLRGLYNRALDDLCRKRGLVFVDDFSPLLGYSGTLDVRYQVGAEDHHLSYAATEEPILRLIRAGVQ